MRMKCNLKHWLVCLLLISTIACSKEDDENNKPESTNEPTSILTCTNSKFIFAPNTCKPKKIITKYSWNGTNFVDTTHFVYDSLNRLSEMVRQDQIGNKKYRKFKYYLGVVEEYG